MLSIRIQFIYEGIDRNIQYKYKKKNKRKHTIQWLCIRVYFISLNAPMLFVFSSFFRRFSFFDFILLFSSCLLFGFGCQHIHDFSLYKYFNEMPRSSFRISEFLFGLPEICSLTYILCLACLLKYTFFYVGAFFILFSVYFFSNNNSTTILLYFITYILWVCMSICTRFGFI